MKIADHDHVKYITIPEFNQLIAEHFAARLAEANLASKSDIANFVKTTYFDDELKNLIKKMSSNETKHALVENELKNYRHLTKVCLLVKSTFSIMEHNFT